MSKSSAVQLRQRNLYVEQNLDLVRPIATSIRHRLPPSFELDDLLQAGNLGLMDAASKYKRSTNVPFRFYAQIRIRGAILDTCTRRHYRNATHAELEAACFEIPSKVEAIDERIHRKELIEKIRSALDTLSPEDSWLIASYFLAGKNLETIGRTLGVCEMRASQRVKDAKVHMRDRLLWQGVKAA